MVPSHLRWLEVDAPAVLPAAVRAYRVLLGVWLPAIALASIGAFFVFRGRSWDLDPAVLAGTVVALACSLVAAFALKRIAGAWGAIAWLLAPTAIFTAAGAVRLAERVCSMYSLPRSMVNSRSCTSR